MDYSAFESIRIPFFDQIEHDFFVISLGYNNFDYIKPLRHFRSQTFYTLHIILEGSGTLMVDDTCYKPKAGMMFFVPPEVRLSYFPDDETPWKYVWFELQGESVPLYARKMGFNPRNHLLKCRDFTNIQLLFRQVFNNHLKHGSTGYYEALSVFYKILDTNLETQESKETDIVNQVISYIHCHYHNPGLSLPDLCQFFGISHSYLCKLFKETAGCSMKNFIIQVRITNACKLLETTGHSIKEIAFSVGFTDENHFMKTFKSVIGETPTEYRKNKKIFNHA